jgi:predicted ATP-dependent serine protease
MSEQGRATVNATTWKCDCGKTKAPWFAQCPECEERSRRESIARRFSDEEESAGYAAKPHYVDEMTPITPEEMDDRLDDAIAHRFVADKEG